MAYIGNQPVPQATQTRDRFVATSAQTSFATNGYTPGFLDVYLNGVHLDATDYTATNGSDVVLASGAASGDIVEVVAYSAFEAANALPAQTGNTGKYLTTDGSTASWGTVDLSSKVAKSGDTMTGQLKLGSISNSPTDVKLQTEGGIKLVTPNNSTSRVYALNDTSSSYTLNLTGGAAVAFISDGSNNQSIAFETHLSGNWHREQMRIDPYGRVTTPYQPGFEVTITSSVACPGSYTTIPFNSAIKNTGGHFNTSTGVFTAPVSGVYHFSFNALYYPTAEGTLVDLKWLKNSSAIQDFQCSAPANNHFQRQISNSIYLSANDTFAIQHRTTGTTNLYASQTYYTGVLLG